MYLTSKQITTALTLSIRNKLQRNTEVNKGIDSVKTEWPITHNVKRHQILNQADEQNTNLAPLRSEWCN